MPTSATDTTEIMPHPTLTKIMGKPTQRSIAILRSEVLANARAIHSDEGDGILGHARIVLTGPEYTAASQGNVDYNTPVKPPPVVHAINATADTMYRSDKTYKEELAIWKLHQNTQKKLLQQLLEAVDDTYTKALKDPLWAYGTTTPLAIINHLKETYGKIKAQDLQENRAQLNHQWSPPDDIENFFDNINTCIAFSTAGGDTISEMNAVHAGVGTLRKTGLFSLAIRDWNKRDIADQTLNHFIEFFRTAEEERQADTTTTAAGYHQANIAATEAQTVSTANSSLTATTLETQMATLQQLVRQATAAANAATAATIAVPTTVPNPNPRRRFPLPPPTDVELLTLGYCWTHGHCHNPNHTSMSCLYKAPGHIDSATAANPQEGNMERYNPRRRQN